MSELVNRPHDEAHLPIWLSGFFEKFPEKRKHLINVDTTDILPSSALRLHICKSLVEVRRVEIPSSESWSYILQHNNGLYQLEKCANWTDKFGYSLGSIACSNGHIIGLDEEPTVNDLDRHLVEMYDTVATKGSI